MSLNYIRSLVLTLLLITGSSFSVFGFHLIGGEITWECQGSGQYIFRMSVYRDCNGPPYTTSGISLRVWDHPTVTSIPMVFVSQTDISPACTQVPGGPSAISCSSGGSGAIERYLFQSLPISLPGVPPTQGWAFTYDNFSRNLAIDNLQTPNLYGITLRAIMYNFSGSGASPCFDSSPTFLEAPGNVICSGTDFKLNHHAYDADGDSLVFAFGPALDQISPSSPDFDPPVNPIAIPYTPGYAFNSPTPGTSFDPGNIPATIDPQTGEISFRSNTVGNFVVVVKVSSYKCGQLVSEIYRETQIVVVNCSGNNLPVFTPPFAGSYSTTVYAGDVVSFNITATDADLLQDGSPQTISLTASGNAFGAGFTNPASGCDTPPCATLNTGLPASSTNSITRTFTWQTDCSHLANLSCGQSAKVYQFVFRAADDFCPAPGVSTATVSIKVLPVPGVDAPHINCADVALNGDVTITWTPPADPMGSFVKYEFYNANSGALLGSNTVLGTSSFTHIGADAQNGSIAYCIKVISGCNGAHSAISDTIRTMLLDVTNAGTGVAILEWDPLFTPISSTAAPTYTIWREYPLGTWTAIGSTPYGTEFFTDTISICEDTINYQVTMNDASGCVSTSSIDGGLFTDLTEPHTPVVSYVTVDTASGLTQINWYPSTSPDTEGYIILENVGGTWQIVDTIYGITNTTYTPLLSSPGIGSEIYGIAAFDSCWHGSPPTPNTSSLSNPHNTIYITTQLNICDSSVTVSWTPYTGWTAGVDSYEIYARQGSSPYVLVGTVGGSGSSFLHTNLVRNVTYTYLVRAIAVTGGVSSLSNIRSQFIRQPQPPSFAYLQTATVVSDHSILVRYLPDVTANISHYKILRSGDNGYTFVQAGILNPGGTPLEFLDEQVNTQQQSYVYKVVAVDSCGKPTLVSNEAKTIFLQAIANSLELANHLNWNPYYQWNGSVNEYRVLRSMNNTGIFDEVGSSTPTNLNYKDNVSEQIKSTGEFCYKIVGVENINSHGFAETSESNVVCVTQDPLVYVPNAFTPDGDSRNDVFLPIVSYVDYTNYDLQIYNRWGEVIFRTSDVNLGWDGTENNKKCREGVYVYLIQFKTGDGKDVVTKGHVTLLYYNE